MISPLYSSFSNSDRSGVNRSHQLRAKLATVVEAGKMGDN